MNTRTRLVATQLVFALVLGLCAAIAPSRASEAALPMDGSSRSQCEALQHFTIAAQAIALPTQGAATTQAVFVPAGAPDIVGEYCLVDGEIAPVDQQAQKIRFRVALPSRWNGKSLHLGGGGFDGQVVSPIKPLSDMSMPPLARGYAVFSSDSGHQSDADANGLDASFALNAEQLRNFAGEQLKKTHDAVMLVLKRRYGAGPAHSYFYGGSEGGREALTVLQQYGADYDGVVALFSPPGFTAVLMKLQVISRAMRLKHGSGWISKNKALWVRDAELAACDSLDGARDSIISNAKACKVDYRHLRCPKETDTRVDCLTQAQLETLQVLHSRTPLGYQLAGGETALPAYSVGADFAALLAATDEPPEALGAVPYFQAADTFVRFVLLRDPHADSLAFDPQRPGKSLRRVLEVSKLLDRNGVDFDPFIAKGGKWILIQGQADGLAPATATVAYYQRIVRAYGKRRTDQFLRFYLVPGYGHGQGLSFNAANAPSLDALEDWVERGHAPGTWTVVDANPQAHGRSRPLCLYPAWPKYTGSGDSNLASSFACVRE